MHSLSPTLTFTTEPLVLPAVSNSPNVEVTKPSLRERVVTKIATTRLAILQAGLKVRNTISSLAGRIFSLLKRSKNDPIPTPASSPQPGSPLNKSPIKQDSPLGFDFSPIDSPSLVSLSDKNSISTSASSFDQVASPYQNLTNKYSFPKEKVLLVGGSMILGGLIGRFLGSTSNCEQMIHRVVNNTWEKCHEAYQKNN